MLASVRYSSRRSKPVCTKYVGQLVEQLRDGSRGFCVPKSSTGSTRPRPNRCHQTRLTPARGRYGLSREAIQMASCSRRVPSSPACGAAPAGILGQHDLLGVGKLHLAFVEIDQPGAAPRIWIRHVGLPQAGEERRIAPEVASASSDRSDGRGTGRIRFAGPGRCGPCCPPASRAPGRATCNRAPARRRRRRWRRAARRPGCRTARSRRTAAAASSARRPRC